MSGSKVDRRGALWSASLLSASLLGLCVAASSPVRAADDGYANVFSSVLGSVGLIKGDPAPDIEYRERPPLVLPKEASLPKPAAGGATRSAAWPQDPDVLRHRKEAEEARAPRIMNPFASDKAELLSHDEMMKGRAQGEPVRPNNCGNDGQGHNCTVLSPDVLREEGEHYRAANPDKGETVVAGQEPSRDFLTQPPKGYMKSVKSVKATAEAPEPKLDDSSPRYMAEQAARRKAEQE